MRSVWPCFPNYIANFFVLVASVGVWLSDSQTHLDFSAALNYPDHIALVFERSFKKEATPKDGMSDLFCHLQLPLSRARKCWVWLFIGIFLFLVPGGLPRPALEVPLSLSLSAPPLSLEQAALPVQKPQCSNLLFLDLPPSEHPAPLPLRVFDPPSNSPQFSDPLISRILEGQPQFLPRPPPIC